MEVPKFERLKSIVAPARMVKKSHDSGEEF